MVLWLLTEGFLPGLLLLVKCEGNKKNVTGCERREISIGSIIFRGEYGFCKPSEDKQQADKSYESA